MIRIIFSKSKDLIAENRLVIPAFFMLGLILDIFINPRISDLLVLFLIVFWVFNILNLRLTPIHSLILAVFSYSISFIIQFLGNEMVVEKGATWFFVFLTIALVQKLIGEVVKSEKKE